MRRTGYALLLSTFPAEPTGAAALDTLDQEAWSWPAQSESDRGLAVIEGLLTEGDAARC